MLGIPYFQYYFFFHLAFIPFFFIHKSVILRQSKCVLPVCEFSQISKLTFFFFLVYPVLVMSARYFFFFLFLEYNFQLCFQFFLFDQTECTCLEWQRLFSLFTIVVIDERFSLFNLRFMVSKIQIGNNYLINLTFFFFQLIFHNGITKLYSKSKMSLVKFMREKQIFR